MPHYIFNVVGSTAATKAHQSLRTGMWSIDGDEHHRDALAAGDLVLVYLGAPARVFIGCAELATLSQDRKRVRLTQVEEWDPPVPIGNVLSELGPTAKGDFDAGVVEISAHEYETALTVAATTRP